ncbi:TPA: TolC family outer membrane protein [Photobacterium damselae]
MKHSVCKSTSKSLTALAVITALFPMSVMSQTLEQAVAETIDSNPTIQQVFNQFKAREEQVNQAESGYLPSVDMTAGYGLHDNSTPISGSQDIEYDRSEVGVSLRQSLFNGFFTTNDVNRLGYETSAQQWKLFSAAENMALQVAKVYLNYMEAEQVVALSEKNLEQHQHLYEQIKEKTESGLGSTADLSQSKGRLARAHSNLIAAKNNLADARSDYIKVVNQSPNEMIEPIADADLIPKSLDEAIAQAKAHNPTLKSALNDIKAAEFERKSVQANYYPDITFEMGGQWSNESYDHSNPNDGHTRQLEAGIKMHYNLFNGGKDTAREREAAYKIGQAKSIQQNSYREAVDGTTLAWNAYQYVGEQKQFIREHVIAAKETQSDYTQQFKLGQRSLLDLLDSENELFEARKDYLRAEYDELIAQYRLLNATGQLLGSLRVTTPDVWYGEENYKGGVEKK